MARYITVIALSAFLVFLVQPLMAKAILPWFGGAPAVWTTSMLFFQTGLLAGYGYAHWGRRLPLRRQLVVHLALLALSLLALPIIPSAEWKPVGTESPAWRILGLLAVTIGAPYLLLASTAPLLQDWYGRDTNGSPYRLYAWSNTGSLLALLAYPFVVEPALTVDRQAWTWSAGYVVFGMGTAWIALRLARGAVGPAGVTAAAETASPSRGERALWFSLAACGSGLLLAITNQLALDVASVPFLWIIPLSVYLVTFILAFGGWYRQLFWRLAFMVGLGAMAVLAKLGASAPLAGQIGGALFALLAACMICHGELARRAPAPAHLTAFYVIMSAGGAAGGLLVGLLAPAVLRDFWELPFFLLLPYVLLLVILYRDRGAAGGVRIGPLAWVALAAVGWLGVTAFVLPALQRTTRTVETARNFYGVLRVADDAPALGAMRRIRHGRIVHGTQFLDSTRHDEPTSYYARGSGVDLAITQHLRRKAGQPLTLGAVGLGAGTIAAYGAAGDRLRFYEINPDVLRLALAHFTFLRRSPASVEVVLGDARLSLERELSVPERRGQYDVMVLDAFSGDAVPVHLLTIEAMALYWAALKPDGVLAIHVSNRHLNLTKVVLASAPYFGKRVVRVHRADGSAAMSSTWLLVSGDVRFFHELEVPLATGTDVPREDGVLWTDQFSNLLSVLED